MSNACEQKKWDEWIHVAALTIYQCSWLESQAHLPDFYIACHEQQENEENEEKSWIICWLGRARLWLLSHVCALWLTLCSASMTPWIHTDVSQFPWPSQGCVPLLSRLQAGVSREQRGAPHSTRYRATEYRKESCHAIRHGKKRTDIEDRLSRGIANYTNRKEKEQINEINVKKKIKNKKME